MSVPVVGRAARQSVQDVSRDEVVALIDRGRYDRAEQVAQVYLSGVRSTAGAFSLAAAAASDLLVQARCLNGNCVSTNTLELARQALETKRTLHADDRALADSLINVGKALSAAANYEASVRSLDEAVALLESPAGELELARALDSLGETLILAGKYDRALRVLDRSLAIKEERLTRNDVNLANTLRGQASALQWKGDYGKARVSLDRARAIQEAAGASNPSYAETLTLLGLQLWFEGNLIDGRDISRRALDAAEMTLRPDHPTVAYALQSLAVVTADLGDIAEAQQLLERALSIAERTFGPGHPQTARFLNDLAHSNLLLDDYPQARKLFVRALNIVQRTSGTRSEQVATYLHNLALIDAALGDYASARRLHARALAIWEQVLEPDHPYVAVALTELATVYLKQGSPSYALPLLERALAIRERRLGAQHRDVARTLADLSATIALMGQFTRAQDLAGRALRIWDHIDAPDAPDLADVLVLCADLEERRGNAAGARDYYTRATAIRAKVFGRSHPDFAAAESGLARALAELGEGPAAMQAAAEAERTAREHLRMMLRYLPEREGLTYALSRPKALDLMVSLSETSHDAADIALNGVVQSRALVLDEMMRRRAGERSRDDTAALRQRLGDTQRRLVNLVVRGPDERTSASYLALVAQARRAQDAAESELVERSAPFREELTREQVDVAHVRAAVPDRSALVSFVRYERQQTGSKPSHRYLAYVVRPHEPTVVAPLGSAAPIERLVSQWRGAIVDDVLGEGTVANPPGESARSFGRALRQRIWDPIAPFLRGAETVFIVPDGTLSLVPFVALPIDSNAYLIERAPVIHYLPAERDLVNLPGDAKPTGHGILALGGPDFDDATSFRSQGQRVRKATTAGSAAITTRAACDRFQALTFSPLAGTLQEVREIADHWASPGQSAIDGASVLVAGNASERAFKQGAPGRRVLHLATHGFFLSDACSPTVVSSRSVGGLVSSGLPRPQRDAALKAAESPLLFSGLALAGANARASAAADDEDGILTAAEVAAMDLHGVEWAVLSACETGVGQIKSSEGVFGLRRAFQIAGAHTVIMSLWSVDDESTSKWMQALYAGRYQRHLTTARAVHEATLNALRERRAAGSTTQPFYWAAFVAQGDWR
jgi:CHAT domain-containing protein/tetratricopeptide (TPR) repeat protein